MRGTIGIIGPKRMDYDKVVSTLKTITHQLDDLYKDRKQKGQEAWKREKKICRKM